MDNIWQDLHYRSSIMGKDVLVLRGIKIQTIDMKDEFDIKVYYITAKGENKWIFITKIPLFELIID